jgi:hypothetical protein
MRRLLVVATYEVDDDERDRETLDALLGPESDRSRLLGWSGGGWPEPRLPRRGNGQPSGDVD